MPMLPFVPLSERWHERGMFPTTKRVPFANLADEVCLHCASPLNTECGFCNISLKQVLDTEGGAPRWRIETLPCMCPQCDEACGHLPADGSASSNRRECLLERHRFVKLDWLLGVDSPVEEQRRFELNQVPVLQLRRILLDEREFAWAKSMDHLVPERDYYENVFCSFAKTAAWLSLGGEKQARLFELVASDRSELDERFQLDWPEDTELTDGHHWYMAAVVVRVSCALRLAAAIRTNLAFDFANSVGSQWVVLELELFADTHLDLHLMCDLFSRHDDEWIERPMMMNMVASEDRKRGGKPVLVNEAIQFSPLESAYPHPIRCVYSGELASATGAAAGANLWTDVQDKRSSQVGNFVHVFMCKALNHRCVAKGTLISLGNGTARPVEDFLDEEFRERNLLLSPQVRNGEVRQVMAKCSGAVSTGTKKCLRLTLSDGRTMDVTEDHRIMKSDGSWIEAKDIQDNVTQVVLSPFRPVEDTKQFESGFSLSLEHFGDLSAEVPDQRQKLLAFCRLVGYATSDGWISDTEDRVTLALGTKFDMEVAILDADLFGGCWVSKRTDIFEIALKTHLSRAISKLSGIQRGRKIKGQFGLPEFLLDNSTPPSLVREFLGAHFGGDGVCPTRSKADKQDDALEHVYLLHHSLEENQHHLENFMKNIVVLLEKCGVEMNGHRIRKFPTYGDPYGRADGLRRFQTRLHLPNSLSFAEKVGFRYCNQKQMRLTAGCIWWNRHKVGLEQRVQVLEKIFDMHAEGIRLAHARGRKRGLLSFTECRDSVVSEFKATQPVVFPEMLPVSGKKASKNNMESSLRSARKGSGFVRNISKFSFLASCGCDWFKGDNSYINHRDNEDLPTIKLKVVGKEDIGEREVYDLEVPGPNAFFANGIGVHNCLLREFDVMLCRELGNFPIFIRFMMNLLEVFQLGAYPGPRFRPPWRTKKLVRKTHHYDRFTVQEWCPRCNADVQVACPKCHGRTPTAKDQVHQTHLCDVCSFVCSVKLEIFLAAKEFFVYQIRCQRAVEALLLEESGWRPHTDFVHMACDDARQILSTPCRNKDVRAHDLRKASAEALRHLELMHDCGKMANRRLYKSFALYELFLSKMNRVSGAHCEIPRWTGCQQPGDFLLAPLHRYALEPHVKEHPELADLLQCDRPLEHLDGSRWCDVYELSQVDALAQFCGHLGDAIISMLPMVGVSPGAMEILEQLHFNSDERDMPDNATQKVIKDLYFRYPVDFHVVHHFFRSIKLYQQVNVRALDAKTAQRQAAALRLRHHVPPECELPEGIEDVFFCRHCKILYSAVVEPPQNASLRQRRAVYEQAVERDGDFIALTKAPSARGVPLAFYDTDKGCLMCSRDADSSNTKKFSRTGLMDEPMWLEDKKRATSIREARQDARPCRVEPLEKVSLIGKTLELGGNVYTRCVVCASVCHFSNSTMCDLGPTCGRHFRLRQNGLFTNLRQCVTPSTQQVRSFAHRMLFPVTQAIRVAPKEIKFGSPAELKVCVTSTPVIDSQMFAMVQEEIYRDANGKGAVMRSVRAEPKNTFFARLKKQKELAKTSSGATKELVRCNTETFERIGASTGAVLIACACCGKRCEAKEEFTRITVNNVDGALVDFLWRHPIENTGLVDIWLCKNDYHRSLRLLKDHPVPLCSQLYFSLAQQREESLQRVMNRQFRK